MEQHSPDTLLSGKNARRLTTVMAIDVCGYSALSERDERKAIQVVRGVSAILDSVTRKYNGRRFHQAGDGFLVEFQTASDNLNAALEITEWIQSDSELQSLEPTACRIGLHAGEVTEQEGGDLLGHGVNIAARLQGEADEGGILASSNFMNLVSREFTGRKRRRGFLALKNISEPVEAFDIEGAASPISRTVTRFLSRMRQNSLVLGLFGVTIVLVITLFAFAINGQVSQDSIDAKVEAVMRENFQTQLGSSVDAAYTRGVLQTLAGSRQPADRATFALLEQGNISGAISKLESELSEEVPGTAEYIQTLHQIGALSHHYAPRKALAAYESILIRNRSDNQTRRLHARTLQATGSVKEAQLIYEDILASAELEVDLRLGTTLNLAFILHMQGKDQAAEDLLVEVEDEILTSDQPELKSGYLTERGLILERLDRLNSAESYLLEAAAISQRYGYDSHLERSYNVLGLIALKRENRMPNLADTYLKQAETFFLKQLEVSKRMGKKRAESEALHFLGDINRRQNRFAEAEAAQLEALRLGTEHGFESTAFMAWVGLAEIAFAKGNETQACEFVARAEFIGKTKLDAKVGPVTKNKIRALPCPYDGIN